MGCAESSSGCADRSGLQAKIDSLDAKLDEYRATDITSKIDSIEAKLDALVNDERGPERLRGPESLSKAKNPALVTQRALKATRTDGKFDIFVSHAKKLPESEDRAIWIADVSESNGLRPFFDRSELKEITEPALKAAMLSSSVCVTVLDPFTFNSAWVFKENLLAANAGIPIVFVFDSDKFRWEGQLDKWQRLYPWAFGRQVVPVSKSVRRASVDALLDAIAAAQAEGLKPPPELIVATMGRRVQAKVGVGGSRETETRSAVDTAYKGMVSRIDGHAPSIIISAFTCTHDAAEVAKCVHELAPGVPMLGCTSCRGVVLNDTWLTHRKEFALGLWGISDDAGTYSVLHIEERPKQGPRDIVFAEVMRARKVRENELPSFALLLGSPGDEELILNGMEAALGEGVPILGGSSGDNTVAGAWRQIAKVGSSNFTVATPSISENGITIAVCWASCQTATTLVSGFRQTKCKGKVTKVDKSDHGRTILEIDGKKVKDVYERWSKGEVTKNVEWKDGVATVLAPSSFMPLGEPCAKGYMRVMHPAFMNKKSGALTTFADAHEGMEIVMLDAAPETLAKKISQSARDLLADAAAGSNDAASISVEDCVGAFMIFCGGLVMAIDDGMPMAAEQLAEAVGHNNTMGICCFGEQGMNVNRKATHGNLMFGCLLFSSKPREGTDQMVSTASVLPNAAHVK